MSSDDDEKGEKLIEDLIQVLESSKTGEEASERMMALVKGFSGSEAEAVFEEASARLKARRPALSAEQIDEIATAVMAKMDADEMPLQIEESEETAAARSEVGRIADLYAKSNPLKIEAEFQRFVEFLTRDELFQRKYGGIAMRAMTAKIIDTVLDEMNQRPKTKTPIEDAVTIAIEIGKRLVAGTDRHADRAATDLERSTMKTRQPSIH